MALPLLIFTPLSSPSSSTVCCTPPLRLALTTSAISASSISRLHMKPIAPFLKSGGRVCVVTNKRCSSIVKAFSDSGVQDGGESQSESDDDDEDVELLFDKLPLDSKLQLKLEQKLRMKFSKKIRLRRKKLVHKRRMRKRGRLLKSAN